MAGEINFSGFNGFDFNQIVDVTIEAESAPLRALEQKDKDLRTKDSALGSFGVEIAELQDPVGDLVKGTVFTDLEAASTDEDVATVTLGDNAVSGTYNIVITQLARAQVTASTNGYTNTTDTAADGGTISFTIDGSTTTDITISAATTVAELKTLINAQDSGVVASVVNDGTNNKLVISSRVTGATNGFTINNSLTNGVDTVVAFAGGQSPSSGNSQDAQDSAFTVNGLSMQCPGSAHNRAHSEHWDLRSSQTYGQGRTNKEEEPMNYSNYESAAYKETSITTSSETQLIVMLYEGAIRFLREANDAIGKNNIPAKSNACDRALAIVQHLHLSLDMERGQEISAELERLYSFVISKIVDGSSQLSAKNLDEAIKVLDILRTAWTELAQKEQAEEVPTELLVSQAAKGRLALHG